LNAWDGVPREGSKGSCGLGGLTASLEVVVAWESVQDFAVEAADSSCDGDESSEKEDHVKEFKTH